MPTDKPNAKPETTDPLTETTATTSSATSADDTAGMSSGYGSAESGSMDAGHRYTGDAMDSSTDANTADPYGAQATADLYGTYTDSSQRIGTPVSDLNLGEEE